MKKLHLLLSLLLLCVGLSTVSTAAETVECWRRFEVSFKHKSQKNPFDDVTLTATFTLNGETKTVTGFYDGNDTYRIRFMPTKAGTWNYVTSSNVSSMNRQKGVLNATLPTGNNHGMVTVKGTHEFQYADGKPYHPFGTTLYTWTHLPDEMQEATLAGLDKAGFNKARICLMPKAYGLTEKEPKRYPYAIESKTTTDSGKVVFTWDYKNFNPEYFQFLERRIDQLDSIGVECDLILFHPYDEGRWGFDSMPLEEDLRYLRYVGARLSSFKNVWWSLANEFDFLRAKKWDDWTVMANEIVKHDPYRHLCSIHGYTGVYYDYWQPAFTHLSVQDNAAVADYGRAMTVRNMYRKPVIFDEVNYEGNHKSRWARMSGQEMLYFTWQGLICGTYVTHGECFITDHDPEAIFWIEGGELKGESWKRIKFTRQIIEDCPNQLQMCDMCRDEVTATAGQNYYIVYLGRKISDSWEFDLPHKAARYPRIAAGTKFRVEIIDTWDMTVTLVDDLFEATDAIDYRVRDVKRKSVRLPMKPYLALRITAAAE